MMEKHRTFSGNALAQQEPDAQFPMAVSEYFEARGYTWDPSSPAFIMESTSGKTLCIPTIFVSYIRETLGFTKPQSSKHCMHFDKACWCVSIFRQRHHKGDRNIALNRNISWLIIALLNSRPDMLTTGRTLFGHSPAKGQQLKIIISISFRTCVCIHAGHGNRSIQAGNSLKTRHNEVAPSQFECARFSRKSILGWPQRVVDGSDGKGCSSPQLQSVVAWKPYAGNKWKWKAQQLEYGN